MTAEEFYKSKSKKFPEVNTIIEWLEEYGEQQWDASLYEIEQYVFNLYVDRDNYSRGKLIEIITDKIEKLKK